MLDVPFRLAATACLALACSPLTPAQVHDWPAPHDDGRDLDMCSGDFTSTLRRSAVVTREGSGGVRQLFLVFDPARHESFSLLAPPVRDPSCVAALGDPGRDRFVVTGSAAPAVASWDEAAGEFDYETILDASWGGLVALDVRRIGTGLHLLAGYDAGGRVVTAALQDSTVLWSSSFVAGQPLRGAAWVEWGPTVGLALLSPLGVGVFDPAGAPLDAFPIANDDGAVAAVRQQDGSECLAVLYSSSRWQVVTFTPQGPGTTSGALDLVGRVAVQAADLDRDGDDDLHVWQSGRHDVLILENVLGPASPTSPFDGAATFSYALPGDPSTPPPARPRGVVDDFDLDGSPDALNSASAFTQLMLRDVAIPLTAPSNDAPESVVSWAEYAEFEPRVQLGLDPGMIALEPGEAIEQYLIQVWRQPDPSGSVQGGVVVDEQPLDPEAGSLQVDGATTFVEIDVPASVETDGVYWPGGDHLWIEILGFAAVDAAGDAGADAEFRIVTAEFVAVRLVRDVSEVSLGTIPIGPYLEAKFGPHGDKKGIPTRPWHTGVVWIRHGGEPPPLPGPAKK